MLYLLACLLYCLDFLNNDFQTFGCIFMSTIIILIAKISIMFSNCSFVTAFY